MRICFIADAGSVHVQRIVSYYIEQGDDVLVLSTGASRGEIPGAQVVHLIAETKSIAAITAGGTSSRTPLAHFKWLIPHKVKAFVKRTVRHVKVLSSRDLCVEKIAWFKPDVLFCNRSFPEGALASRCAVSPLLLRTAGQDISKFAKYPVYRQLIYKALRRADIVMTQSRWEQDWLRGVCSEETRIEVNNIGVDTGVFRPEPEKASVRSHYGLPGDAFVVLSNRYLTKPYNGWLILEAIESLLEKCPKLHLLYVSPRKLDLRSKIGVDSIASRSSRIHFVEGPVAHSEMAKILNCADIYVTFSSYDGIPNSLLEAMACGVVPVVAELPQLREWIEDGIDGYIVPQRDAKALAAVVSQLYLEREGLPGMAGRCVEKVRMHAAYERCSQRTRNLLESIARKPKREASRSYVNATGKA